MCLLSLGSWQGYKEGEAKWWGEGEEVTDRSPCPLERDPRTGRVVQSHPPSQRRQLDIFHIVFSCVLIPFSRNPVADPQFLSSCSPIWGWACVRDPAHHAGLGVAALGHIHKQVCGPRVPDGPLLAASCAQCVCISSGRVQSMPSTVSVAKEELDLNPK